MCGLLPNIFFFLTQETPNLAQISSLRWDHSQKQGGYEIWGLEGESEIAKSAHIVPAHVEMCSIHGIERHPTHGSPPSLHFYPKTLVR